MNQFDTLLKPILDDLQFRPDSTGIVIDQLPIGYGGQLSRRFLGLKLALALGRKALFLSETDAPYVQSMERPFASIWDQYTIQNAPLASLSVAGDNRPLVRFDYAYVQGALGADNTSVEKWLQRTLTERYQLSDDDLARIDGWLLSWVRFLPAFEERLCKDAIRFGVSSETLGVHLRRGDKHVESPYVPASHINGAIFQIYQKWRFNSIFVASDDPQADSVIEMPPGVRMIFDRDEKRYNNANHKMLMSNPAIAAQETYVAYKNLRLLAQCGGIVGQDNAHFATIAASHVLYRHGDRDRIVLLNGNVAKEHSHLVRAHYLVKLKARELAKNILPRGVVSFINRIAN
ncbi:ribosomal protein S9 [Bradyrhizobium sp. LB7.2]